MFNDPGAGYAAAIAELDALVDEQCAELGLSRSEAIFAGFSQGAGLALGLGLFALDPERTAPAGVLAMSPFAPGVAQLSDAAAAGKVPVLVQHGTHDPLIPVKNARELARELAANGVPTVFREYPMEHKLLSRACATRAIGSTR